MSIYARIFQKKFMNKDNMVAVLKDYFESKADSFNIDMAFLYGSWACGYPLDESDIDVAVLSSKEMDEDMAFEVVSTISLELTEQLRHETNVLYMDTELSKPMLHYNAIVHGIPVYIKDFERYVDLRLKAISQMEDFSLFGTKWQAEIVRKRMEALNRA